MCAHRACYFTTDFIAVWLCNLLLLYTAAWSSTPKAQSVACGHIVPATLLLLFTTAFYCYLTFWVWSYSCFTNCCFSWFTYPAALPTAVPLVCLQLVYLLLLYLLYLTLLYLLLFFLRCFTVLTALLADAHTLGSFSSEYAAVPLYERLPPRNLAGG
jgi:hypothetical protein